MSEVSLETLPVAREFYSARSYFLRPPPTRAFSLRAITSADDTTRAGKVLSSGDEESKLVNCSAAAADDGSQAEDHSRLRPTRDSSPRDS